MGQCLPDEKIGSPQTLEEKEPKIQKTAKLEKIKYWLKSITVEPAVILLVMPRLLCNLTNENLNLEKACYVNLGLNDSVCYAMVVRNKSGYTASEEIAVQQVVSILLPYKQACHVLQIVTLLLVSSLCDRIQKVKPMFYIPFIGDISALIGYIVCVYFFMSLSAEYSIFIEGVLPVAFGGFQLLLSGAYGYVASRSDHESRTVRIGSIAILHKVCITLGTALSGYTFKLLGFYGVYLIALSLNVIGMVYALFFIKNIPMKKREQKKVETSSCCYLVWNGTWNTLCNSMKVCFKKGSHRRRAKMITLQAINFCVFGIMIAEMSVSYLYTRKNFGWDEVDYSMYKLYRTIIEIVGSALVLTFISKYLKWSDVSLGILAVSFKIFGSIILALSSTGLVFYLGTLTHMLCASVSISVRSLITKVVDQHEQTMVNSITSVIDSIGIFIVGSIYPIIYYNTVAIFPGAFYLCSSFIYVIILILFCVLHRLSNPCKS